jgi:hypothetical protein
VKQPPERSVCSRTAARIVALTESLEVGDYEQAVSVGYDPDRELVESGPRADHDE